MWRFNQVDQPEGRGEPYGLYPGWIDPHHHSRHLAMVPRQHCVGSGCETLTRNTLSSKLLTNPVPEFVKEGTPESFYSDHTTDLP